MNKTRIFILLTLFVCASLWSAPAARASDCPYLPPDKYKATFMLNNSPPELDLAINQRIDGLDIRNTSSDPIYLLGYHSAADTLPIPSEITQTLPPTMTIYTRITNTGLYYWHIDQGWYLVQKDIMTLSVRNARNYLIGDIPNDYCGSDDGIPDGQTVPPPHDVVLKVLFKEKFIDIPVTIDYKLNPNYDVELEAYQKDGQESKNRREQTQIFCFAIQFVVLAAVIAVIFRLEHLKDEKIKRQKNG